MTLKKPRIYSNSFSTTYIKMVKQGHIFPFVYVGLLLGWKQTMFINVRATTTYIIRKILTTLFLLLTKFSLCNVIMTMTKHFFLWIFRSFIGLKKSCSLMSKKWQFTQFMKMYSIAFSSLLQCHYHEGGAFFSLNILVFYWVENIVFLNVIATPTYTF